MSLYIKQNPHYQITDLILIRIDPSFNKKGNRSVEKQVPAKFISQIALIYINMHSPRKEDYERKQRRAISTDLK